MAKIDLLLTHCSELATCATADGQPARRAALADPGIIRDGAVAIDAGKIVAVGSSAELHSRFSPRQTIDCSGRAVVAGFVDCHTHAVFGGDRVHEFEMRIGGASYMEIMAAGGGILSTMRHTRAADQATLLASAEARLRQMLACGSTSIEIKTGYGLDLATELKMLRVIDRLAQTLPLTLIPTFLGAHTVPPEYKETPDAYVDLVVNEMLPAVARWYAESSFARPQIPLFCDVFCEDHAFDVAQSRRILQAAKALGLLPKIHVDQFHALGGVEMALELGAVSADHLDVTDASRIGLLARSDTVCVPLPAVNFNLGLADFADARGMVDAGAAVALATDLNPGSAPCYSMPLVMAIACRYQRLLPTEALMASTINAAHAAGVADRVGSIEVGKQADLLLLASADVRHLSYFLGGNPIEAIIQNGQLIR